MIHYTPGFFTDHSSDVIPADAHYKQPRKSLYKRPRRHVEGRAKPLKHRSNENIYANVKVCKTNELHW